MTVDLVRLEAMNTFTDPEGGISERFVDAPMQSGSTMGVLSLLLGKSATAGWLVTHPFGPEHGGPQRAGRRHRNSAGPTRRSP